MMCLLNVEIRNIFLEIRVWAKNTLANALRNKYSCKCGPSENLGLILQSTVCCYNITHINTAAKGTSSFIAVS